MLAGQPHRRMVKIFDQCAKKMVVSIGRRKGQAMASECRQQIAAAAQSRAHKKKKDTEAKEKRMRNKVVTDTHMYMNTHS